MALLTTAPRGTKDILPRDSAKWQYIERTLLTTAALFGYKEMRVPTFEHTELFNRSVGETTDVVNKEMYTFQDKGGRSITLRPEGTAGMARAAIENGLLESARANAEALLRGMLAGFYDAQDYVIEFV